MHAHVTRRSAILVLGVPGSGKSALCRLISQRGHAIWFSASTILREHARRNPLTTTTWREGWALGQNAPDEDVLPILWHAYAQFEDTTILLDGYPRTSIQLRDFIQRGGQISATLLLSVKNNTALSRIVVRSKMSKRLDDDLEVAERRIKMEQHRITELLRCPEIEQRVLRIDAEPKEGDVAAVVLAALAAY